jgi:hypothetical protein
MTPLLAQLPAREALLADIGQVRNLIEAKEYAKASELANRVLVNAKAAGLESAQATWMAAVAADYAADLEAAFVAVTEAIRLDPLSPEYQNSWEVIARRVRAALADPERVWDDPTTPRLYELLRDAGQADGRAHLQHVRYLVAVRKPQDALRALDALTMLMPTFVAAWELLAQVAREVGDEQRLAEAEAGLNGRRSATKAVDREDPEDGWSNAKWGQA